MRSFDFIRRQAWGDRMIWRINDLRATYTTYRDIRRVFFLSMLLVRLQRSIALSR